MPAAFQLLNTTISKSINTEADLLLEKLGQNRAGSRFLEDSLCNYLPSGSENIIIYVSLGLKIMFCFFPNNHHFANPNFAHRHEQIDILVKKFQKG